jgi:SAM-dependent methyltransferase
MSSPARDAWERAEVARSALEASLANDGALLADEREVVRYLNPPADTVYPLEYAYHLLGDVRGKTVLDYGCGDGLNTHLLARRGAAVKALDISPELLARAQRRVNLNQTAANVEFLCGSAHDVPVADNSIDVVFGIAILHHLDLAQSALEVWRVLRPGGRAIFQEPVRNSRTLSFVRSLIPYRAPDVSPYERPLTDRELATYAAGFSSARSKAFLLPTTSLIRVVPVFPDRWLPASYRLDARLLARIPALRHFAVVRVLELVK